MFCESIGNPAGNIVDIERLADIAHKHGVPLIVDSTVSTPYLCQPFEFGADIVVHSLTKYIGGHGTTIGGMIVDSGKFDWVKTRSASRLLNEPDPSYHGVVYTEAFGPAAFIGRCRVVPLRNTGAALVTAQRISVPAGAGNAGFEDGTALRERAEGRAVSGEASQGGMGQLCGACPAAGTMTCATGSARARPRAYSASASGAERQPAAQFIDALKMILRLVNIGDAKSLACHPASTTHRQLNPDELKPPGFPKAWSGYPSASSISTTSSTISARRLMPLVLDPCGSVPLPDRVGGRQRPWPYNLTHPQLVLVALSLEYGGRAGTGKPG